MPNLSGKVCLVTGASRGIGRGIALQLLTNGATVYITGRNKDTLLKVREEAEHRQGTGVCIPVECDHTNDESVKAVFERIGKEQQGRLDLLVNNAYAAVNYLIKNADTCFWEQSEEGWDIVNNVGLRNHFLCSMHAARLMVPNRSGLIVNISSVGGSTYFISAAYGVGKAAKDRMARDCAHELEKYNVAFVSLWPGPVRTEIIQESMGKGDRDIDAQLKWIFDNGESTEFAGKAISHLLLDKEIIKRTGQILLTTDLSDEFNFNDVDGKLPVSMRSIQMFLSQAGMAWLGYMCPRWLKIPFSVMRYFASAKKPNLKHKVAKQI